MREIRKATRARSSHRLSRDDDRKGERGREGEWRSLRTTYSRYSTRLDDMDAKAAGRVADAAMLVGKVVRLSGINGE
jgi:hypothetical protein